MDLIIITLMPNINLGHKINVGRLSANSRHMLTGYDVFKVNFLIGLSSISIL